MATVTPQAVQKLKCDRCGGVMVRDEISTPLNLIWGLIRIGFAVIGAAAMLGAILAPPLVILGGILILVPVIMGDWKQRVWRCLGCECFVQRAMVKAE